MTPLLLPPFPPVQREMHLLTSQGRAAGAAFQVLGGAAECRESQTSATFPAGGLVQTLILQVSTERERGLPTASQEGTQTLALPSASATQISSSEQESQSPAVPDSTVNQHPPHPGAWPANWV